MYTLYRNTRNRYVKSGSQVQTLPAQCCPTHVVRTAEWIISLPRLCTYKALSTDIGGNIIDKFEHKHEKQIVGKIVLAMDQLPLLREKWEQDKFTLFCGANGGLKDGIGTSGYTIFINREDSPLVHGHAAEIQEDSSASSTIQESLAQTAVEYWIRHLAKSLWEV